LRKKENNRIFGKNNPGYSHGRYDYVERWRQKHPDYQRQWRAKSRQQGRSQVEIQAEREIKASGYQSLMELFRDEIQVHIAFGDALIENLLRMNERIHKRLPVGFVQEVLQAFNGRRTSEREAMELLGLRRSRLHQLRKRWPLSSQTLSHPHQRWPLPEGGGRQARRKRDLL
jgi:hypothetical protein